MVLIDAKTLAERFPQASISSPKDQMLYENLKSDELREAFKKIERLVKVRDRSVLEVRNRLHRDGFVADVVDAAIDRALSVGYLDDARFADVLVRSRLRSGKGYLAYFVSFELTLSILLSNLKVSRKIIYGKIRARKKQLLPCCVVSHHGLRTKNRQHMRS